MIASEKAGAAISYGLGQGSHASLRFMGHPYLERVQGSASHFQSSECRDVYFIRDRTWVLNLCGSLNNVIFIYSGKNITFVLVSCLWEFNNEKDDL